MKNRRPRHLPDNFLASLAWLILILTTGLTANEAFSAPDVKSNLFMYRYPQDDLGATYSPQATTMKLWSPAARNVELVLFEDATNPSVSLTPMICDSNGVWSVTLNG